MGASPILGKMVSGISMTIVVGAICNDSPDYRERCWELCARANHQYTFWRVGKRVVLTKCIGGPGQIKMLLLILLLLLFDIA